MNKREERVAKYTADLEKLGLKPDVDLLEKCVAACGPSIYNADAETVASSDPDELETVRKNFIAKRLGIVDEAEGNAALDAVVEQYGRSNRSKYRAVIYYLLSQHLKGRGQSL